MSETKTKSGPKIKYSPTVTRNWESLDYNNEIYCLLNSRNKRNDQSYQLVTIWQFIKIKQEARRNGILRYAAPSSLHNFLNIKLWCKVENLKLAP